jgi:RNA 2',3'-cyclic 3'-phosphodiesterase
MMHRLFVAARPSQSVRAALIAQMGGLEAVRWQDDAHLHLTLRYIGEVDARTAEDICLALSRIRFAAISATLASFGSFSPKHGGAQVWIGVRPDDALRQLHQKIDHAVVSIGLQPERRAYLPHITLARCSRITPSIEAWLASRAPCEAEPFEIASIGLYESHLGREGAHYTLVEQFSAVPQRA